MAEQTATPSSRGYRTMSQSISEEAEENHHGCDVQPIASYGSGRDRRHST